MSLLTLRSSSSSSAVTSLRSFLYPGLHRPSLTSLNRVFFFLSRLSCEEEPVDGEGGEGPAAEGPAAGGAAQEAGRSAAQGGEAASGPGGEAEAEAGEK